MALQKQTVSIPFSQGLDLKTDPLQVEAGKFLALSNSVFTKSGLLEKRNGFPQITSVTSGTNSEITTYNNNLTVIGDKLWGYNQGSNNWKNHGAFQLCNLSTIPALRNSLNQTQVDIAIASNGVACVVYSELNNSTTTYKWTLIDSVTGQSITSPTAIVPTAGAVSGAAKVFVVGQYFVVVFTATIAAVPNLEYFAIGIGTLSAGSAVSITAAYTPSSTGAFDGYVANNQLYLAWNGNDGGGAIRARRLDSTLAMSGVVVFSGRVATLMSVTADQTGSSPVIYISFYDSGGSTGYVIVTNQNLVTITAATQFIATGTVLNLTSTAQSAVLTVFYEISNNYSYDSAIASHYIKTNTITSAGTVGTSSNLIRSVGLATKAVLLNGVSYFLAAYSSTYQPTYFLVNGSGQIIAKLAYENGGGYVTTGLGNIVVNGSTLKFGYLFKDLVQALTPVGNAQQTFTGGIYSQTGINIASLLLGSDASLSTVESGRDFHLSGGFLWMYDGLSPVEHNFFVWPDNVELTWSATGGSIHAQPDGSTNSDAYYYQVTYEWCDAQGNIFRSAPSIPVSVTTTGNGTAGSITVNVPSLRLTYKTVNANLVKIVIYRWSVAQQTYHQVTSITAPTLNPTITTTDSVAYVDTLADASISGNNIIYTTGGVIEDVNGPASNVMTLFDGRLWLIDAEDKNLWWFSKEVIEAVPVEMSDLLTYYVDPNLSHQGNTGPLLAGAAMDDKLISFKKDSIFYTNGKGPDNTGSNSQYSQPIFVTSTVGCSNQNSIVFIPNGLIFQSDKGFWLLGRDLSTSYIGAPVNDYNGATCLSAVNVPATNQVRFTLDNGVTLQYDYFYNQWGTFDGIPGTSSTIYNSEHTYLNSTNVVFQQNPLSYQDGSNPTLMKFTTAWFHLANLQGFQRAYFFYFLGTYVSPHKLMVTVAYDYNSSPTQTVIISPNNYTPNWGSGAKWGSEEFWGGPGNIENWKINMARQKCEAFQVTVQEIYDPTFSVPPGAGFTLSGINLVIGTKKGYRPIQAALTAG